MKITALAPWFGSNRLLAHEVGRLLADCSWVGIPFSGSLCEVAHIDARTVVASDLHRHVINLARVAAHPVFGPALVRTLRRLPFHPDTLTAAQVACRGWEHGHPALSDEPCLEWAVDYFVTAWMGRNGLAGTDGEFRATYSIRWEAGGGDSVVRFRSAISSLRDFRTVFARVSFVCEDVFDFLRKVKDRPWHGVYADPPWADDGNRYTHKFTEADQRRLAKELAGFRHTRVVVRFGDHPLVRELYPEADWTWHLHTSRTGANKAKAEVLLVRNAAG